MEAILVGLVFAVALGLNVWAAKSYATFYDGLTEEKQRAIIRRAMQRRF